MRRPVIKAELRSILERYSINPDDEQQCWSAHGTLVLYHKAFERIAAQEGIRFDPPVIVRAERDEAVILVTGHLGDKTAFSFGEACLDSNYRVSSKQPAYVFSMAEKRGIDRVVAKLIGIAGFIYSEEEADEFKTARPAPAVEVEEGPLDQWERRVITALDKAQSRDELDDIIERAEAGLDRMKANDPARYKDIAARITAAGIALERGLRQTSRSE